MTDESAEPVFRPTLITLGGIAVCGALGTGFWLLARRLDAMDAAPWLMWTATGAYVALIMAIVFTTVHVARRASGIRMSIAAKRYSRRVTVAMLLYAVILLGSLFTWATLRPTAVPIILLLALIPAAPLVVVIGLIGVYLREEDDEFLRTVMNQSALLASGGVLAIATVWGFCEMFRLAPHAPSWIAFPLWCLLFALVQPVVRLRYR